MADDAGAAYFDAHRDDPDEWGDPVPAPPHAAPRRLRIALRIVLDADDADRLRHLAKFTGRDYAALAREALRRYLHDTHIATDCPPTAVLGAISHPPARTDVPPALDPDRSPTVRGQPCPDACPPPCSCWPAPPSPRTRPSPMPR